MSQPHDESLQSSRPSTPKPEPTDTDPEKAVPKANLTEPAPSPPPDGGLQAWLVVLGGFCTVFASFGWINCIGIFQNYYQTDQLASYSPSTVAWIPSTETFIMFFCGPITGILGDTYGPRFPILLGSFLHVFGLMMTSISHEYYQIFLAQSVASAAGCSFLFFPTLAAIGQYFSKHRALALGIAVSGSSIGGVILPIMVDRLIPRIGFGWAMRSLAFLILGLLVIGNILIKARLPPPKRHFHLVDFVTPLTEVPFALLTASSFFIYLGGFLPFTFVILQARNEGMSTALAGYLVSILNGASTFGRIIPAYFGDRYGVFNVMILNTFFCGVFVLAVWLPSHSNAPVIMFSILYGFVSGCTFSIIPAMVASISDVRKLGARVGCLYAVSAVGALIGSPTAGVIINRQNGGYQGLIIFSGIGLLVGTGLAVASRQALVGRKLVAKV
ncbi:hypothetical protein HBI16_185250 [Parastagonospora nodorum]|nr:hypothetical protein HBI16_185250 [Parastagonospora nodorum]KAH6358291.1 hypothetical protein HBI34_211030 [Parastagonospora nodorum]